MSSELYMENWDLQAVVGGSSSNINFDCCISNMEINPPFLFDPWSFDHDQQESDVLSSPEIFETKPKVLDELQELYKPFYPDHQLNPFSNQTIITNSLPLPIPQDSDEQKKQQSVSDHHDHHSATNKDSTPTAIKPKRSSRKSQQNRVVQHVKADDSVSSDIWAWRKYGQKPIKGSPYPRSYYRCSSSKGCLARKQVERSCSDPGTFIITYTAEHSHAHPTRRNSLAGSTRTKSISSTTTAKLTAGNSVKNNNEACPCEAADHQTVVSENEDFQRIKLIEEQMFGDIGEEGDRILTPDHIMQTDGFVQSLEDSEGLFLNQFSDLSNELWSMQP